LVVVLVGCVVSAGGLCSAASVLAAEVEAPWIDNAVATGASETTGSLEAQIDPHGGETAYEFWLECQYPTGGPSACEPVAGGQHAQGGRMSAGSEDQTVTVQMTGLQPGS
jgi:hypothetical protein